MNTANTGGIDSFSITDSDGGKDSLTATWGLGGLLNRRCFSLLDFF